MSWLAAHVGQMLMVALTVLEVVATLLGGGNLTAVISALKGLGVKDVDGQ